MSVFLFSLLKTQSLDLLKYFLSLSQLPSASKSQPYFPKLDVSLSCSLAMGKGGKELGFVCGQRRLCLILLFSYLSLIFCFLYTQQSTVKFLSFPLRRQYFVNFVLFDAQQLPIKKHDNNNNNNKKAVGGSLGIEGRKPATTECILKQFAPIVLAVGKLEITFARNQRNSHF